MSSAYSAFTRDVPPKRLPPKRKSRRWLARAAAGVMCLLLVVGLIQAWNSYRAAEHRRQLVAQLQKEQNPAKLREAVRSGQLTRDDARQVFASRMRSRLDSYFKLPPGPRRVQYLDESIRDLQSRRRQFEVRRAQVASAKPSPDKTAAGAGAAPDGGNRAARMESIPPEQRAMMQQFRLDMQQRMRQLGVGSTR